jgi:gas vesicle protein
MWLAGILIGAVVAAVGVFKFARGTGRRSHAIDGGTVSESWLAEQRALKDGSDR